MAPLGSTASFTCTAVGDVFWSVNGLQVLSQSSVDLFAASNIFVPLPTPVSSIVNVTTRTGNNNGTSYQCLVEQAPALAVLNMSAIVTLLVYGESLKKGPW